jgi:hypothetical protein
MGLTKSQFDELGAYSVEIFSWKKPTAQDEHPEAVLLVMCDPSGDKM